MVTLLIVVGCLTALGLMLTGALAIRLQAREREGIADFESADWDREMEIAPKRSLVAPNRAARHRR